VDYPVVLERDDNGTILVGFPDFPDVHTFGENEVDALTHAVDALATGIDAYVKDRRDIPIPSAVARHRVTLPTLSETRVRLYEAMRRSRVSKAELSRRLHWHPPQVDRLLNMTHESRLSQLEAAFSALGKRLVIGVNDLRRRRDADVRQQRSADVADLSSARRPGDARWGSAAARAADVCVSADLRSGRIRVCDREDPRAGRVVD
jgi:antitoxin HicB